MEYLQCGLIRVEDIPLQQFFVQQVIDRGQPMLRRPQQLVGHGLPGQRNALAFEFLFLPVQRRTYHKLLHHKMGHSFRRDKTAGDKVRLSGRRHHRSLRIFLLPVLAGMNKFFLDYFSRFAKGRLYQSFLKTQLFQWLQHEAESFFDKKVRKATPLQTIENIIVCSTF